MNREQRRRDERDPNRRTPGYRPPREVIVPPERQGAAMQDFMAGTIFAAGAAGLTVEQAQAAGIEPPVFMVVFDDRAYGVAPKLRELRELQRRIGTEALATQIEGRAGWDVATDPGRGNLGRLNIKLESPIRMHADFLVMLDNYRELLPVLTGSHVLCLVHMDDVNASGGGLGRMLEHVIMFTGQPSTAITRMLEDPDGGTSPAPMMVMANGMDPAQQEHLAAAGIEVVDITGHGEATYTCRISPDGIASVYWTAGMAPYVYDTLVKAGMHQLDAEATTVPVLPGWSITLGDDTFEITGAHGEFIVSGTIDASIRDWPHHALAAGEVHAIFGLTADVHDYLDNPTGRFAQGVITTIIDHRTQPTAPHINQPPTPAPDAEPGFWRRIFGRR